MTVARDAVSFVAAAACARDRALICAGTARRRHCKVSSEHPSHAAPAGRADEGAPPASGPAACARDLGHRGCTARSPDPSQPLLHTAFALPCHSGCRISVFTASSPPWPACSEGDGGGGAGCRISVTVITAGSYRRAGRWPAGYRESPWGTVCPLPSPQPSSGPWAVPRQRTYGESPASSPSAAISGPLRLGCGHVFEGVTPLLEIAQRTIPLKSTPPRTLCCRSYQQPVLISAVRLLISSASPFLKSQPGPARPARSEPRSIRRLGGGCCPPPTSQIGGHVTAPRPGNAGFEPESPASRIVDHHTMIARSKLRGPGKESSFCPFAPVEIWVVT